jgi:pantoate--beta-alanine ligase
MTSRIDGEAVSSTPTAAAVMPVARTIEAARLAVAAARRSGLMVGFVPTMGALHDGHGRLIERAAAETGFVVVSIFVNPTQFNDPSDLERYPRTPERDHALCARLGTRLIFEPGVQEMYRSTARPAFVEVPGVSEDLEGRERPGHFRGVATVVLKLLNIVRPDVAYFGEKDYQQLLLVRKLVADLDVPVEIQAVETVREADGLAMSSRNARLGAADRQAAAVISRALKAAQAAVAGGEASAERIRQILEHRIRSEPRARLKYAEIRNAETLEPLIEIAPGKPARALVAAELGGVRLIDNMPLIACAAPG